jgi:hypothetical protein
MTSSPQKWKNKCPLFRPPTVMLCYSRLRETNSKEYSVHSTMNIATQNVTQSLRLAWILTASSKSGESLVCRALWRRQDRSQNSGSPKVGTLIWDLCIKQCGGDWKSVCLPLTCHNHPLRGPGGWLFISDLDTKSTEHKTPISITGSSHGLGFSWMAWNLCAEEGSGW